MKSLLLALLTLTCFLSFGQTTLHDSIVPIYEADPVLAGENIQFIPVNFNADKLLEEIPSELKSLTVERIDLVYSTYKENPEFNQEKLNAERMKRLKSAWPEARNPLINWNSFGQFQAADNTSARSLFHGFVIYYREKPTTESIERELDAIDAYLEDGVFPAETRAHAEAKTSAAPTTDPEIGSSRSLNVETRDVAHSVEAPFGVVSSAISESEEVMKLKSTPVEPEEGEHPRVTALRNDNFQNECYTSEAGILKGSKAEFKAFNDSMMRLGRMTPWSSYSSDVVKEGRTTNHYYVYYILNEECEAPYVPVHFIDFSSPMTWDSKEFNAVQATFDRHPHWQNTHIIMDVTGSMSPYIAKTMAWIKATQDSSQVSAFTFFNDGDATPDRKKRVGKVGGIYSVENNAYKPVYKQMKNTMRKGGGGDCPENNIEATISGMQSYPDCEEIIMVADNWATPRDLSLLSQVEVPIHIIVCGGQMGINVAFIQAAYETGGSVHTIEDDLDLRSIEPGKQFRLGKNYFTVIGGKVVRAEHK